MHTYPPPSPVPSPSPPAPAPLPIPPPAPAASAGHFHVFLHAWSKLLSLLLCSFPLDSVISTFHCVFSALFPLMHVSPKCCTLLYTTLGLMHTHTHTHTQTQTHTYMYTYSPYQYSTLNKLCMLSYALSPPLPYPCTVSKWCQLYSKLQRCSFTFIPRTFTWWKKKKKLT